VLTIQSYTLTIIATDGGQTQRSSTANVTVHVVTDRRLLPPRWQLVNNVEIDDLTDVSVSEDVAVNTLISDERNLRLEARSSQGTLVRYFLSNNGPLELNGNSDFKIPSPNPFNNTSLMPIATGRIIDASTVSSYILRLRAFVSICSFVSICICDNVHTAGVQKVMKKNKETAVILKYLIRIKYHLTVLINIRLHRPLSDIA